MWKRSRFQTSLTSGYIAFQGWIGMGIGIAIVKKKKDKRTTLKLYIQSIWNSTFSLKSDCNSQTTLKLRWSSYYPSCLFNSNLKLRWSSYYHSCLFNSNDILKKDRFLDYRRNRSYGHPHSFHSFIFWSPYVSGYHGSYT